MHCAVESRAIEPRVSTPADHDIPATQNRRPVNVPATAHRHLVGPKNRAWLTDTVRARNALKSGL